MPGPKHIKFGGARISFRKPPAEINRFVYRLSPAKRTSLWQTVRELRQHGMIEVDDEHLSTIDDEMLPFQK